MGTEQLIWGVTHSGGETVIRLKLNADIQLTIDFAGSGYWNSNSYPVTIFEYWLTTWNV